MNFLITARVFILLFFIIKIIVSLFRTKAATWLGSIFMPILVRNAIILHVIKDEAEFADNEG